MLTKDSTITERLDAAIYTARAWAAKGTSRRDVRRILRAAYGDIVCPVALDRIAKEAVL